MQNKLFPAFIFFLSLINCLKAQNGTDRPIVLQQCNIRIAVNQFTATTDMELVFYNPNARVLDGEYNFSLSQGQVITRFALDINGFMREGVMVDKQQGRVAYENTIRRRIDPGLLEMTTGNNYRVRIYPMQAKGTRKIRITVAELLAMKQDAWQYYLPLSIIDTVRHFNLSCTVSNAAEPPVADEFLLKGRRFEQSEKIFSLQYKDSLLSLNQAVSFKIPIRRSNSFFAYNNLDKSFALAVKSPPDTSVLINHSQSIAVFWDVSLSAAKRDIEKEITFLEQYILSNRINRVQIITFSNEVHDAALFVIDRGNTHLIHKFLKALSFDGATRLGELNCNLYNADEYLLFSDGINSMGNGFPVLNSHAFHCINSCGTANHDGLKRLAESNGGVYINLANTTVSAALEEIKRSPLQVLSVKQNGTDVLTNLSLPSSAENLLVLTGLLSDTLHGVEIGFGKQNKLLETVAVPVPTIDTSGNIQMVDLLSAYAGVQKSSSTAEVIAFAKTNLLVTAFTSFIVLDNVDDYIQYGIVPPEDMQQQYQQKIYAVKQKEAELKKATANEETDNLKKAVSLYNERIRWWNAAEAPIKTEEVELKKEPPLYSAEIMQGNKDVNKNQSGVILNEGSKLLSEVVVTAAYGIRRRNMSVAARVVSASEISAGANTVAQALAGKVAGVQVVNDGIPGTAERIIMRGQTSLSSSNEVLYIVDGVPAANTTLQMVNVNTIDNITVLKGAEASVLYGSRGANGVVIINTGSRYSRDIKAVPPRYQQLEDMDYVTALKEMDAGAAYLCYLNRRNEFLNNAAYYFDVAKFFHETKQKGKAWRVLSNLCEIEYENHQLLRAAAYVLEEWKMYPEAIEIYTKVLQIKEEEPQSYRDLALAYERNGNHQQAVDLLYRVITKNFYQYEARYRGIKSLLLNEMNAIINQHQASICLSKINSAVIKPLPVDIRIVADWNKDETDIDLHIVEPGGATCYYGNRNSKDSGRLSEDFTQGYGPEEYEVRKAKKGKYYIRINYYGDRYQKVKAPAFVKLTIYKNFGRPNQTVYTESFNMENQNGLIEIGDVKL